MLVNWGRFPRRDFITPGAWRFPVLATELGLCSHAQLPLPSGPYSGLQKRCRESVVDCIRNVRSRALCRSKLSQLVAATEDGGLSRAQWPGDVLGRQGDEKHPLHDQTPPTALCGPATWVTDVPNT